MPQRHARHNTTEGFTLIELSIVLVVIGLIVGAIFVGRDLIEGANLRAQIGQIEKFKSAVNTFRLKYNTLPGDMTADLALAMGFGVRGSMGVDGYAGAGDGNGLIEGFMDANAPNTNCGVCIGAGETVLFWNDLTYANGMNVNLVQGNFTAIGGSLGVVGSPSPPGLSSAQLVSWYPAAKMGAANYVYAFSMNGFNYYGLSRISTLEYFAGYGSPGLSVQQAYTIDQKMDDGLPQAGTVTAEYVNYTVVYGGISWASGNLLEVPPPDTTARAASPTTCYDNGGAGGAIQHYSTAVSMGTGVNCALSFRF